MKINFKFLIVLTILLAGCICIGSTFAADSSTADITVTSVDNTNIEIAHDDSSSNEVEITNLQAGNGSFMELQGKIDNAADGAVINLDKNYTFNKNTDLANGMHINKSLTIDGRGFTIDGFNLARVFNVTGNNVIIKNINFINTNSTKGGAIYWEGSNGTVRDCTFTYSTSSVDGGAIYWTGADGTISSCTFTNSTTEGSASAIFWWAANGNVNDCSFINSTSSSDGGAIYWYGYDSINGRVSACNFTNSAARSGGAIFWNLAVNGSVSDCSFINSTASVDGGAIYFYHATNAIVRACNFTKSTASVDGGTIHWSNSDKGSVNDCIFTNSNAKNSGGAICWNKSINGSVSNCIFTKSTVSGKDANDNCGGAIFWNNSVNGSVSDSNFVNCSAKYDGGAIYWRNSTNGSVSACDFTKCTALDGGAISLYISDNGSVDNCTFINSTSSINGGAINWMGANGSVSASTFINSTSSINGGAINWMGANGSVSASTFINSTSSINGGAICWVGANGSVSACNFTNSTVGDFGGAICWVGANGSVSACNFTNSTVGDFGGAICWVGANGSVSACNFINSIVKGNGKGSAIYIEDAKAVSSYGSLNISESTCIPADDKAPIYNDGVILSDLVITTSGMLVAGGTVKLTINGEEIFNICKTPYGFYPSSYIVDFNGSQPVSATYLNGTGNQNVPIHYIISDSPINLSVSIDTANIDYGDVATVNVTVAGPTGEVIPTGNVTVFVNGYGQDFNNNRTLNLSGGKCNFTLSDLGAGLYKITVLYNGDNNYNSIANSTYLVVSAVSPEGIDVTVDSAVVYGDVVVVDVVVAGLDGKAIPTGNVIVFVNDTEYDIQSLTDGKCNFTLSGRCWTL